MTALISAIVAISALLPASAQPLETVDDLSNQYYTIFQSGNRNAASHLWTKFLLDRSHTMPAEKLTTLFQGFCAVSGSPLPNLPDTMYKVTLPLVTGGQITGVARYCCWPCVCDMTELVSVDTKTVTTATGKQEYKFLVIGDPCSRPEQLEQDFVDPFSNITVALSKAAPEVVCEGGKLKGAHFSDHGYPIIGMLFMDQLDQVEAIPHQANDPTYGFGQMCIARKKDGYNSGMGLIFHLVAEINPIKVADRPALPPMSAAFEQELGQKVELKSGQILPKVFADAKPCVHGKVPHSFTFLATLGLAVVVSVAAAVALVLRRRRRQAKPDAELTVAE